MKILHIGGLHFSTLALCNAQIAAGHTVISSGISPAAPPLLYARNDPRRSPASEEIISGSFDLAHYHALPENRPMRSASPPRRSQSTDPQGACALMDDSALLASLSRRGVPIVFSACSRELLSESTSSADALKRLLSSFAHVFLSRTEQLPLLDPAKKWSWLPQPVDPASFAFQQPSEPAAQNVRILHIPFDFSPDDTDSVIDAVARLRSRGLRFHFTFSAPSEFKTEADLISALAAADLFIEDLQNSCPGPLAVLAMSLGKTVISGNSRQARAAWKPLQDCPVLHADAGSIFKRLDALIREPRSLRDIGRRSRAYVERYHAATVVAAQALEVYKRLLN